MKRNNFLKILFPVLYLIGLAFTYGVGSYIRYSRDVDKMQSTVCPSVESNFCYYRERSILSSGDIENYHLVKDSIVHDSMSKYPTYFFFSIVMADVYNYSEACYDVYKAINDTYSIGEISMDEESRKLMLHYLRKGERLGDAQCKKELDRKKIFRLSSTK